MLYYIFNSITVLLFIFNSQRMTFIDSQDTKVGLPHPVSRNEIFDEVIKLYQMKQSTLEAEFPYNIRFTGERAIDTGDVSQDMFTALFKECYKVFFDGGMLLTPIIHPQTDTSKLPILGAIISHAYLVCGYLPVKIAFPTLAAILLGPATAAKVSESVLLESLTNNLSTHQATNLKEAIKFRGRAFPPTILTDLLEILSSFGCREVPQPTNLKRIVLDVAKFEFLLKPATTISIMHSGISAMHNLFWSQQSIDDLHDIYATLTVSPVRVLSMIKDPCCTTANQERVMSYLRQLVGSMSQNELRAFMRFVTGASVCLDQTIKVTFNSAEGLSKHPRSHCCDSSLELPSTYATYPEFASDFNCILSDTHDNYNWIMDAL